VAESLKASQEVWDQLSPDDLEEITRRLAAGEDVRTVATDYHLDFDFLRRKCETKYVYSLQGTAK
jgi:hypothetical protein